jgi:CspA family cold shock protein
MLKGKVKWFSDLKGYGFIEGEGGPDIFVHHTVIICDGYKTLLDGEDVLYDREELPKGPAATRVIRVRDNLQF